MHKQFVPVLCSAALAAGGLVATAGETPVTLYTYGSANTFRWCSSTTAMWTNETHTAATAWIDGALGVVQHQGWNNLMYFSGTFDAYGFIIQQPSPDTYLYWTAGGTSLIKLGAGGLDVRGNLTIDGAANTERVRLTANQTWRGPSGSTRRHLNIGTTVPANLTAADGVDALTVTGNLGLWLMSSENDLANVTVRLESQSELYLPDDFDARVNAKKLVLCGDGNRIRFGAMSGATDRDKNEHRNVAAVDAAHLASEVELADGADVSAEGGIYAVPTLDVSAAGSVVTGDLTFTQAVNRVVFTAPGATLTFETANAQSGVEAGFDVSGPGTLTVNDLAPLTGAIAVNDGATFVMTLDGRQRVARSISGNGTIVVTGGELYIPAASLEDFTGGFSVTGGQLILDEEPAGGVTVSGTGSVFYGTDPLVVTDRVRTESDLTVASDKTLLVYGNGLTAATALTLAGGTVKFMLDATIASPVTLAADSFVTGCDAEIEGVFTGNLTATAGVLNFDGMQAALGGVATAACPIVVGSSAVAVFAIPSGCTVTENVSVKQGSSVRSAGDVLAPKTTLADEGFFEMTGGDLSLNGLEVGKNTDGSFRQTGGNLTVKYLSFPMTGTAGSRGEMLFEGGTAHLTGDTDVGGISSQWGTFTVDGGEVVSDTQFLFGFNQWNTAYVNLLSGSYTVPAFRAGNSKFSSSSLYVYFDGGMLKLNGNDYHVFGSSDSAYQSANTVRIGPNGATIDTCGKTGNVIDVPLQAMTGDGVLSVSLGDPITGLSSKPLVNVVTPNGYKGKGATATAEYDPDTGTMTGVRILSPGADYTAAFVHVYANGTRIKELRSPVLGAVASGSFTKRGEGDLTLNAANTYAGGTIVEGGTLVAGVDGAIPDGALTIAGGVLDLNGKTADITSLACDLAAPCGGISGLSAATLPNTIVVKNGQLAGADGKHAYKLLALPDGYPGGVPNLVLEGQDDPQWHLVISGGYLKLKRDQGLMIYVR